MRYFVAERKRITWLGLSFTREACSHRHKTVATAARCAEALNIGIRRVPSAAVRSALGEWRVAGRETNPDGEPIRFYVAPVATTVSEEV